MKIATSVLTCLLLGGCATLPQTWYKPGATQEQFQRDYAAARLQATQLPPIYSPFAYDQQQLERKRRVEVVIDLLEVKGYTPWPVSNSIPLHTTPPSP
jgi:hypothetical protein